MRTNRGNLEGSPRAVSEPDRPAPIGEPGWACNNGEAAQARAGPVGAAVGRRAPSSRTRSAPCSRPARVSKGGLVSPAEEPDDGGRSDNAFTGPGTAMERIDGI